MSEEQTVEEEVSLHFRRFSDEKQDQVQALVNYATLMGLDGKDLISIGGKLNRIKENRERDRNSMVAEELVKACSLIGSDKQSTYDIRRWKYKDGTGRVWKFEEADYRGTTATVRRHRLTKVTSDTGATKRFRDLERYNVGRGGVRWTMKQVMLNVHHGKILLNF